MRGTEFQFQHFTIQQNKAAMKIGTDSVLLGAFCDCKIAKNILDIGTGNGLLALMLAQKSTAKIDAVEIEKNAADEAKDNILYSAWKERMHVYHSDIREFVPVTRYDLIITNPPYYPITDNVGIANRQRSMARHDKDLPFFALVNEVLSRLTEEGKFWLILPIQEATTFKKLAAEKGLHTMKEIQIYAKASKLANRVVLCLSRFEVQLTTNRFVIYEEDGSPTEEYYELTKDYYLWKQLSGK